MDRLRPYSDSDFKSVIELNRFTTMPLTERKIGKIVERANYALEIIDRYQVGVIGYVILKYTRNMPVVRQFVYNFDFEFVTESVYSYLLSNIAPEIGFALPIGDVYVREDLRDLGLRIIGVSGERYIFD